MEPIPEDDKEESEYRFIATFFGAGWELVRMRNHYEMKSILVHGGVDTDSNKVFTLWSGYRSR